MSAADQPNGGQSKQLHKDQLDQLFFLANIWRPTLNAAPKNASFVLGTMFLQSSQVVPLPPIHSFIHFDWTVNICPDHVMAGGPLKC